MTSLTFDDRRVSIFCDKSCSVSVKVDLVYLLLQFDTKTAIDLLLESLVFLPVLFEHLRQLLLAVPALSQLLQDLVVREDLRLQLCLSLFLLLDLLVKLANLIAPRPNVLRFFLRAEQFSLLAEKRLKIIFLGCEVIDLLIVLGQVFIHSVNFRLILFSDDLDS